MIPQFPTFKKIELSDKEDVEKFTHKYAPYSDFNFISMWSWDIKGEMRISQLNENLVVQFNNYLTEATLFSFLGTNHIDETTKSILQFLKKTNYNPELSLITEDSIEYLDKKKFISVEDRDHFDYIFDVQKIAQFEGSEYYTKRSEVARFLNKNPDVTTKIIDISDIRIRTEVLHLNYEWLENKKKKDPFFDIKNELVVIDKFLNTENLESFSIGMFLNDRLIGYSFNELLKNGFAVGHFYKTNKHGSFDYLFRESCKHLANKGVTLLNFEQDLGIEGLRRSKMSYRPASFLKKYTVKLAV